MEEAVINNDDDSLNGNMDIDTAERQDDSRSSIHITAAHDKGAPRNVDAKAYTHHHAPSRKDEEGQSSVGGKLSDSGDNFQADLSQGNFQFKLPIVREVKEARTEQHDGVNIDDNTGDNREQNSGEEEQEDQDDEEDQEEEDDWDQEFGIARDEIRGGQQVILLEK